MSHFEPPGIKFTETSFTGTKECLLVTEGDWKGWICYKHPDGRWVTLRKADDKEYNKLTSPRRA
jgi:hypothetical protein